MQIRRRMRLLLAGASALALPVVALETFAATGAHATSAFAPAQFIAKQYTETLGRIPDQPGWQSALQYFQQAGCTASSLATYGESVANSSEYAGLGYDDDARVLTLYRASLNREPDSSGFANWIYQLQTGLPWSTVVQKFFTSSEFVSLVPKICSGAVDASAASYYWGTVPAMAVPTTGAGFTGTENQLQAALNTTPSGGTVTLAQRALIKLTQPLVIPQGVTLTTAGAPDHRHYANMGRLVRSASFPTPASLTALVQVQAGATLSSVWVDGARDAPGNTAKLDNVITYGTAANVSNDELSNPQGPNNLYLFGGFNGYTCSTMAATGNLITDYSSDHYMATDWSDGIADNCEGATINGNQVVDASDVAIVVYRNTTTSTQHSIVTGNQVLSAGNSMYGGLGFDPLMEGAGVPAKTFSFSGGQITDNTFWSGPDTHFDIGITDGTRAWFAGTYTTDTGTGASITNNTTGTQTARVQTGVAVNGMLDTTVTGNTLQLVHINSGGCPKYDYVAELSQGYASGIFSPQPVDANVDGCV